MAFSNINVGGSPTNITSGGGYTFTKVKVIDAKTGETFEAGTSDGRTLVYKTDVLASDNFAQWVLDNVAHKYNVDFDATRAEVDPAAEIGDYVVDMTATGGSLAGSMYKQRLNFASGFSNVGSPGYEEIEEEYPTQTEAQKAYSEAVNYTNSALSDAFGEGGTALQVKVVNSLPSDHASQNVLWVIPTA